MYYFKKLKAICDVTYRRGTPWQDCDCLCVCVDVSGVFTACSEKQMVLNIPLLFSMFKDLRHVCMSPQTLFQVYLTYLNKTYIHIPYLFIWTNKTLLIVTLFISLEEQARQAKNSCRLNMCIYSCSMYAKHVYSL